MLTTSMSVSSDRYSNLNTVNFHFANQFYDNIVHKIIRNTLMHLDLLNILGFVDWRQRGNILVQ